MFCSCTTFLIIINNIALNFSPINSPCAGEICCLLKACQTAEEGSLKLFQWGSIRSNEGCNNTAQGSLEGALDIYKQRELKHLLDYETLLQRDNHKFSRVGVQLRKKGLQYFAKDDMEYHFQIHEWRNATGGLPILLLWRPVSLFASSNHRTNKRERRRPRAPTPPKKVFGDTFYVLAKCLFIYRVPMVIAPLCPEHKNYSAIRLWS